MIPVFVLNSQAEIKKPGGKNKKINHEKKKPILK
jgi:hypothetical protein